VDASSKRKIIFLLSQNDIGGHTKFVLNLSKELKCRGYEIQVYIPFFTHFYYTLKFRRKKNFTDINLWTRYFLGQLRSMIFISNFKWRGESLGFDKLPVKRYLFTPKMKILKDSDIIVSSAHWDLELLLKFGLNPKKIVHVIHHLHSNSTKDLKIYIENKSFNLVVSSETTAIECRKLGINNFDLCNLGVDLNIFNPRHKVVKKLSEYKVGFFYYNHPRKNPRFIEEVVKKITEKNSNLDVLIFGNGFKNFSKKISVIEDLTEIEYAKKIASLDLFVYISRIEGFALPPLEALASGVPVISSDVGAVRKYIEHNRNGLIIANSITAEEVCSLIFSLLNDEKLKSRFRNRGLSTSKEWTWAKTCASYIKVFDKLV